MSRQGSDSTKRSGRNQRHWVVALVLTLCLAAGTPAAADIIYTPFSQTITGNDSLDFLDYQGSGTQFTLFHWDWAYEGLYNRRADIGDINLVATDLNGYAVLLAGGEAIPGNLNWTTYTTLGIVDDTGSYGNWLGQTGYLGLQFDPGDGTHYGWARLSMSANASSLTLYGYAYESDADMPIAAGAGAVPLPGSLVLLASGAAALLACRRLKRPA